MSSSLLLFYLNRNASKTISDRIRISIENTDALVEFQAHDRKKCTVVRMPKEEAFRYISDVLDLLLLDTDVSETVKTVDVVCPNMPIACLSMKELNKDLLVRITYRFTTYPPV